MGIELERGNDWALQDCLKLEASLRLRRRRNLGGKRREHVWRGNRSLWMTAADEAVGSEAFCTLQALNGALGQ